MNREGVFVFVVSIFVLLLLGSVLSLAFGNNSSGKVDKNKPPYIENSNESISCSTDIDCNDGNSCTIDYCFGEECSNTKVVLCYQNDGCCPSGCTAANDNDC